MDENTVSRKVRNKTPTTVNKGGRPRLEEVGYLTPEMEDIAQLTRSGFTPLEISEQLKVTTERVERLLNNPLTEARVKKLFEDRMNTVALKRDQLFDEAVASAIRLMRNDKLPSTFLVDILKRYDPYEVIRENQNKKEDLPKKQIAGSNSMFQPMEIKVQGDPVDD